PVGLQPVTCGAPIRRLGRREAAELRRRDTAIIMAPAGVPMRCRSDRKPLRRNGRAADRGDGAGGRMDHEQRALGPGRPPPTGDAISTFSTLAARTQVSQDGAFVLPVVD
ncbi:hypothetical protein, partial [Mycobacterium sp. E1715]|uniref:hypothetical protein n=1 Tax=Mycobacterium sp. E1715 TaxID=1856863 RepID=UPI001E2F1562